MCIFHSIIKHVTILKHATNNLQTAHNFYLQYGQSELPIFDYSVQAIVKIDYNGVIFQMDFLNCLILNLVRISGILKIFLNNDFLIFTK